MARPVAPARSRGDERLLRLTRRRIGHHLFSRLFSKRAPIHVLRRQTLAVHARSAPPDRSHGGDGSVRVPGRDGTSRAARVAARTGLRGGYVRRSHRPLRPRGGGDGAAWLDRAYPRHDRPPHRGAGATGAAQTALRKGGRAWSRPLRARTHRRRHDLDDRRGRAARDVFRRVPAATLRRLHHPSRRLRAARIPRFSRVRAAVRLRDVHPVRARALPAVGRKEQHAPVARVSRLRGGVPRRYTGSRHPQGVRSEHGARQAAGCARARGVPEHDVGARDQLAEPRYHRHRHRGRERRGARVRRMAGDARSDEPRCAARHPDDGDRGVSPAA